MGRAFIKRIRRMSFAKPLKEQLTEYWAVAWRESTGSVQRKYALEIRCRPVSTEGKKDAVYDGYDQRKGRGKAENGWIQEASKPLAAQRGHTGTRRKSHDHHDIVSRIRPRLILVTGAIGHCKIYAKTSSQSQSTMMSSQST